MTDPAKKSHFLPIAARTRGTESGAQSYVLIAALDTDWLVKHLETATADHQTAHASLIIADREGNVIGRARDAAPRRDGRCQIGSARCSAGRTSSVETLTDAEGHAIVAAYVPSTIPPVGLTVIDTLALPDLIADIDQASYQNLLVIGAAALVALVLAWVAGRRFIYRPTEALLHVARKWREGDLGARATLMDAGSEFSALAKSFNAMAAGLQAREMERRMQSSSLEVTIS